MNRRGIAWPLLAVMVGAAVYAETRTARNWHRKHFLVLDTAAREVARFTLISTFDEQQPSRMRYLYQDSAGGMIIVRQDLNRQEETLRLTFESGTTGEVLEIEAVPPLPKTDKGQLITARVGAESATFYDSERRSASAQRQLARSTQGLSRTFRSELNRLTEIGLNYGMYLHSPARTLNDLLFPGIERPPMPENGEKELEVAVDFDPSEVVASEFDAQFGAAYFE